MNWTYEKSTGQMVNYGWSPIYDWYIRFDTSKTTIADIEKYLPMVIEGTRKD